MPRTNQTPTTGSLLERTMDLLAESLADPTNSVSDVAAASGVGYEWLKKLKEGSIPNPGVIRVQALHDYLASRASA